MNSIIEKLVNENEKLIYWGYNKYTKGQPTQYNDDIFSIANYSLFKTAKKYNKDKGTFSTLYSKILHNEIYGFYRDQNAKIRKSEFGDNISLSTNIKETEGINLEMKITNINHDPISDMIMRENITEFINSLNKRELKVFLLRYKNPKISQQDIGDILGISQTVVCRIFKKLRQKYIEVKINV